jgi:hypothetical protein
MGETEASFVFEPGFNVPVAGFLTSNKDITADVSNLLAVFNRMVYQRRDGVFVFSPYPVLPGNMIAIEIADHVSEPEIKIQAFETVPDGLDFSYRDIDREYDTASVRIGGDNTRRDSYSLDISAGRKEAMLLATNLLNRIRTQTISGTMHLAPEWNAILPGEVVLLKRVNPSGSDIPVIIVRVETGVDLTVRLDFINFAPINEFPTVEENSAAVGGNVSVRQDFVQVVDTEKRSERIGLGYYTTSGSPIRRGASVEAAVTGSLSGTVESLTATTATIQCRGTPIVGEEYYLLNLVDGSGSWCRVTSANLTGPNTYNLGIQQGLYGSREFFGGLDFVILQIFEETVINDGYNSLSLVQDGANYTHAFPTRKRIVEPTTAGALRTGSGVRIYRRAAWAGEDIDFSIGGFPLTYWRITNTSSSYTEIVSSSLPQIDSTSNFSILNGQTMTVQQVDAIGSPILGAYLNSYTF